MSQLSRLISILTLLRSKRILTGNELAERFEVSLRTIYRDIRKLEEAGVPILTIEGRGYSLMEGYNVPPVMFTEMEANALVTAERLIAKTKDQSLVSNFNEALTKIKSIFRNGIQSKSEVLDRKMLVIDTSQQSVRSNSLSEIQLAITNLQVMEINYRKPTDVEDIFRRIEPCSIYSIDEKWILIAWCHLRNDYRSFRIDRIQQFKVLDETFIDREFDIRKFFAECPDFS